MKERFEIVTIPRSSIGLAPYNPRKITKEAKENLAASLEKFGLLQPLIVNKKTMNLVGGHKRLELVDKERGYPKKDYNLTVALVELSEADEIKANVILNNGSSMGHWDIEALSNLNSIVPDLDFIKDLQFTQEELDNLFAVEVSEKPASGASKTDDSVKIIFASAQEKQRFLLSIGQDATKKEIPFAALLSDPLLKAVWPGGD